MTDVNETVKLLYSQVVVQGRSGTVEKKDGRSETVEQKEGMSKTVEKKRERQENQEAAQTQTKLKKKVILLSNRMVGHCGDFRGRKLKTKRTKKHEQERVILQPVDDDNDDFVDSYVESGTIKMNAKGKRGNTIGAKRPKKQEQEKRPSSGADDDHDDAGDDNDDDDNNQSGAIKMNAKGKRGNTIAKKPPKKQEQEKRMNTKGNKRVNIVPQKKRKRKVKRMGDEEHDWNKKTKQASGVPLIAQGYTAVAVEEIDRPFTLPDIGCCQTQMSAYGNEDLVKKAHRIKSQVGAFLRSWKPGKKSDTLPKIGKVVRIREFNDRSQSLKENQRDALTWYLCKTFNTCINFKSVDAPTMIHDAICFVANYVEKKASETQTGTQSHELQLQGIDETNYQKEMEIPLTETKTMDDLSDQSLIDYFLPDQHISSDETHHLPEKERPPTSTQASAASAHIIGHENEEEEMNEIDGSYQSPKEPIKRKAHIKHYAGPTKKPRVQCPVPGCEGFVVNIHRHLKSLTPSHLAVDINEYIKDYNPVSQPKKSYLRRKMCNLCGVHTLRIDLHLMRMHHLERNSPEFSTQKSLCGVIHTNDKGESNLLQAVNEYGKSKQNRAFGAHAQDRTIASHSTAVRFFLKKLTKESIEELSQIGEINGAINKHLKDKTVEPGTLKNYLHALASFLTFLAASPKWTRVVGKGSGDIDLIRRQISLMAVSLKGDINERMIERQSEGLDDLAVEPWMVAKYCDGVVAAATRQKLLASCITKTEVLRVRDSLATQVLLFNAKRAGDVAHMETAKILQLKPGEDAELMVTKHKGAKSGKLCPVVLPASLVDDLLCFAKKYAGGRRYIFTTRDGFEIQPSAMSKIYKREWQRFATSIKEDLPPLTANINRKVAVTALRESGATRDQERALARHMAHNVSTADRYYDRSKQRPQRHAALAYYHRQLKKDLSKRKRKR